MITTYIIGLLCVSFATIIEAVIPVIFQESNLELFSYLFLLSFVCILLSIIHIYIFKNNFDDMFKVIHNRISDINIVYYGFLRYIRYLLYTYGALYIETGIYNTLLVSQLLYLTFTDPKDSYISYDTPKIVSFFILTIATIVLIYDAIMNSKKKFNINYIIAIFAVIISLVLDVKSADGIANIIDNPYEDVFLSSVVMFIISLIVILVRMFVFNKNFGISTFNHLIYIIIVPIILMGYLPLILDYATYDFLPILVILIFLGIQIVFGFLLDKFYYKEIFTNTKRCGMLLLFGGIAYLIYTYYIEHLTHKNITNHNNSIKLNIIKKNN